MLFKVYDGETSLFFESIAELADFCEATHEEARRAYYKGVAILNGYEVISLGWVI